ncbi:MAG: hypothetical protein HFI63_02720 [Lachnospiraceae bacterium]|nr:hypothetical protein [Lachnospiraceae bacterium]
MGQIANQMALVLLQRVRNKLRGDKLQNNNIQTDGIRTDGIQKGNLHTKNRKKQDEKGISNDKIPKFKR